MARSLSGTNNYVQKRLIRIKFVLLLENHSLFVLNEDFGLKHTEGLLSFLQEAHQEILTLDISHLEKELNIEIYGLIGYQIIKDYDMLHLKRVDFY